MHIIDNAKSSEQKEIPFIVRFNLKFTKSSSHKTGIADIDSVYYDQAVLKLPENYSNTGAPVRLVYLAHGAGGGVTDSPWSWNRYSIFVTLLMIWNTNEGDLWYGSE